MLESVALGWLPSRVDNVRNGPCRRGRRSDIIPSSARLRKSIAPYGSLERSDARRANQDSISSGRTVSRSPADSGNGEDQHNQHDENQARPPTVTFGSSGTTRQAVIHDQFVIGEALSDQPSRDDRHLLDGVERPDVVLAGGRSGPGASERPCGRRRYARALGAPKTTLCRSCGPRRGRCESKPAGFLIARTIEIAPWTTASAPRTAVGRDSFPPSDADTRRSATLTTSTAMNDCHAKAGGPRPMNVPDSSRRPSLLCVPGPLASSGVGASTLNPLTFGSQRAKIVPQAWVQAKYA